MSDFAIRFKFTTSNLERIDEIAARVKDFSIPFSDIISEWAKGNVRKFNASKNAEMWGADEPPTIWEPVTEKYYQQKHGPVHRGARKIFPDWLMVRTGALMRSLITRGLFAEYFDAKKAIFGTPLDPEERMKAAYNFRKRPTIFLGRSDRLMIKRTFQNYLSLGDNYRQMLFVRAGQQASLLREIKSMDYRYAQVVNG